MRWFQISPLCCNGNIIASARKTGAKVGMKTNCGYEFLLRHQKCKNCDLKFHHSDYHEIQIMNNLEENKRHILYKTSVQIFGSSLDFQRCVTMTVWCGLKNSAFVDWFGTRKEIGKCGGRTMGKPIRGRVVCVVTLHNNLLWVCCREQ